MGAPGAGQRRDGGPLAGLLGQRTGQPAKRIAQLRGQLGSRIGQPRLNLGQHAGGQGRGAGARSAGCGVRWARGFAAGHARASTSSAGPVHLLIAGFPGVACRRMRARSPEGRGRRRSTRGSAGQASAGVLAGDSSRGKAVVWSACGGAAVREATAVQKASSAAVISSMMGTMSG
jgi:hypothetical protein